MALSPAAGAGALILSCYSEGERDLAARSDSEHLGLHFEHQGGCTCRAQSIQDAEMTGFCLKLWVTMSFLAFFMVRRMVHGNCRVVSWILMQLPIANMWIELGRDNFSKALFLFCDSCFSGQPRIASERKIPGISVLQ